MVDRTGVLGPLQVLRDGVEVDLGGRKQRILLTGLVLTPNRPVSFDALIEMLWGDRPPPAVTASLHGYVAALRRVLEPGRAARDRPQVLLTRTEGYELRVELENLDAWRFTRAVTEVHRGLAGGDRLLLPAGRPVSELSAAESELEQALALWRGSPYAELPDDPAATAERSRLEDLWLVAHHDLARVRLALGKHSVVAADLDALTRSNPLREDLWGLRAIALARGDRQAEALDTVRTARIALADELGIDPGPTLRELEVALLRQDESIYARSPIALTDREPARHPESSGSDRGTPRPSGHAGAAELPLVGRDRQLSALIGLADHALAGTPRLALLTGEPGIGKTRLTTELAASATDRGFTVALGRCSQDEGAPPLWPWVEVLRRVAEAWPDVRVPELQNLAATSANSSPADRFRTFDAVVRLLVEVSVEHPLLLIFDDLHWADPSSLHLLRHLVEVVDRGRLLVVLTRRSRPEPQQALAVLGEALARRGALRLDLTGLNDGDVEALAEATTGSKPLPQEVAGLRERTGGNPFFIVEVLRLGGQHRAQPDGGEIPAAVGDVIAARVGQLPVPSQRLLRDASVLGRGVDLGLLARLVGRTELDLLDELEPALAGGMLVEATDGSLQFSHALVRDAVYASVPPRRRQLRHAEIARLLEGADEPGRRSEVAQHWLQAGPVHAARAWRAAAEAAAYASRLQAHEEAAELLAAALDSQARDPDAGPTHRYELLMARARAGRASANSDTQRAATAEAIRIAQDADDVERMALAAITSSEGALWSNRPLGEVDRVTVEALQRAAGELPGVDTPLRCRVFLALSREMYWAPQPREREAYAEIGLAMARRLDDPQLHAWAGHTAFVAAFRPDTMEGRLALTAEAITSSREAGDEEGEVTGLLFRALVTGEAGMLPEREEAVRRALGLAEQHRFRYLQVMLGSYEVPWLALQGRFAEAEQLYADSVRWAAHTSFPFRDEALAAARLCLDVWQGHADELLPTLTALDEAGPVDMRHAILLLLLRSGRPSDVAAHLDRRPPTIGDDTFESPMILALCAEAALLLRRRELGAKVYPLLAPWEGRFATAGTGTPLGPVDCFLALAAAAVGETQLAERHANRALELCARGQLAPVAAWLAKYRTDVGF